MSTEVLAGWLKDVEGNKFAPKTLASQVINDDGTSLNAVNKAGDEMTGMLKFKPANGTSVVTAETYRNLPTNSPTASYKTRNVIASNGAAMQFFKGSVGADPSTEVNRLTLTETDTQLMKPLTISSGGTGANSAADAIANLGIQDYVVAQGTSGGWAYLKWNSGAAECWYYGWVTPTATGSTAQVLTNAFVHTLTLPFSFTDTNYSAVASVTHSNGNGVVTRVQHIGKNQLSIAWDGSDNVASSGLSVHVSGYWK